MPDCAIFADTGWEAEAVYDHLDWLRSGNMLPFPVHIVSAGNIRDGLVGAGEGKRWASIPAFAKTVTPVGAVVPVYDEDDDGELVEIGSRQTGAETVSIGMIRRQCTTDFKIVPIRRKVCELAGLTRKRSPSFPVVEQWIGISTDEIIRAKPSFEAWQVKRFPLIEQRMSRRGCLACLRRHGYPEPPKSARIGCPFHDNGRWWSMRDDDPEAWADAVEIRALRTGVRGIRGEVYLHRSCVPLDQAELSTLADHGQPDLWPNECEGCAVSARSQRAETRNPLINLDAAPCGQLSGAFFACYAASGNGRTIYRRADARFVQSARPCAGRTPPWRRGLFLATFNARIWAIQTRAQSPSFSPRPTPGDAARCADRPS